MFRYRLLILNTILLLTLVGSQWGRRVEDLHVAQNDFLKGLNLPFRDFTTKDIDLAPDEMAILQPDAVLVRRYNSPAGFQAELAVIAGHRKKSIHTPGFCMAGGGWDILWQKDSSLTVEGRTLPATQALMAKDGQQLIATYFFTDGDYCTRNLVQFQGVQFLKRFHSHIPVGALIRILVPVRQEQSLSEQMSDDLVQATVPAVMSALRQVRLEAP